MWPSELLRVLGFVLAVVFLFAACARSQDNLKQIDTKFYASYSGRRPRISWWHSASGNVIGSRDCRAERRHTVVPLRDPELARPLPAARGGAGRRLHRNLLAALAAWRLSEHTIARHSSGSDEPVRDGVFRCGIPGAAVFRG